MRIVATLAAIATITTALPARAEKWVVMLHSDDLIVYADIEGVTRKGEIVKAPVKVVREDGVSTRSSYYVNCSTGSWKAGEIRWSDTPEFGIKTTPGGLLCIASERGGRSQPVIDRYNGWSEI